MFSRMCHVMWLILGASADKRKRQTASSELSYGELLSGSHKPHREVVSHPIISMPDASLSSGCPTPDAPVASRTRLKHKAAMALKKDGISGALIQPTVAGPNNEASLLFPRATRRRILFDGEQQQGEAHGQTSQVAVPALATESSSCHCQYHSFAKHSYKEDENIQLWISESWEVWK